MIGFEGADRIRAGAGRDAISISSAGTGDVSCGGATDRISMAGRPGPILHADCERVRTPGALVRLRHRARALHLTVTPRKDCPLTVNGRRPRGGTVSLAPRTASVVLRCGTRYAATAFRLTS